MESLEPTTIEDLVRRHAPDLIPESDRGIRLFVRDLTSIGASFVSEAIRVGKALGGLERIGLTHLAGEVQLHQIEALADRIVESAEKDRNALERMAGSI